MLTVAPISSSPFLVSLGGCSTVCRSNVQQDKIFLPLDGLAGPEYLRTCPESPNISGLGGSKKTT